MQSSDDAVAKKLTAILYFLYAVSPVVPLTCLIAIFINYIRISDVRGTWLESHFRWQIRSFWISAGLILIGILAIPITLGISGVPALVVAIWLLYRMIKGWQRLRDGEPMYGS